MLAAIEYVLNSFSIVLSKLIRQCLYFMALVRLFSNKVHANLDIHWSYHLDRLILIANFNNCYRRKFSWFEAIKALAKHYQDFFFLPFLLLLLFFWFRSIFIWLIDLCGGSWARWILLMKSYPSILCFFCIKNWTHQFDMHVERCSNHEHNFRFTNCYLNAAKHFHFRWRKSNFSIWLLI